MSAAGQGPPLVRALACGCCPALPAADAEADADAVAEAEGDAEAEVARDEADAGVVGGAGADGDGLPLEAADCAGAELPYAAADT
jgi:hypothetical protein